jgi:serine protease inhibitor
MGSEVWLHRLREHYGTRHTTVSGEEDDASRDVASSWSVEQLGDVIKQHSPNDVYYAVETALLYKLMPNKTLAFKGEWCMGGKSSEETITARLCTNSTSTYKLLPLVIGK